MTNPPLPSFLYGEDSFDVDKRIKPLLRRIVKGQRPLDVFLPIASPESGRSSVPVVMTPRGFTPGFHMASVLPELFNLLVSKAMDILDDDAFDAFVVHQTNIYAEILSQPWGVLCALMRDAQMWLFDDSPLKDKLDNQRLLLMLQAAERESSWLQSLDGRYEYGCEKLGHLWQADTVISWLAARNGLPLPTSQAAWEDTVRRLILQSS
ncbi:hypothetical protein [Deinococcus aquatilis]|uniref:hypothetical protein n=1 Tax=Deinococcus aquatilis TaxID=519440 RepID=UPI00037E354C|nr:hypothetical protein [Deinococcus aquatilis]